MRLDLLTASLCLAACSTGAFDSPDLEGLNRPAVEELKEALAADVAPDTTSVLVVRDGRLALELYGGDGAPEKLNDTRSATKTLVALAVGQAIADGKLSGLDAQVLPFFPDLEPVLNDHPLKREITVRDLLTMTSALDCDDNNETPGNEENMYPTTSWTRFALDLPTMAGWIREADGLGPWRYCTAGSFLLGQTVERAVGERIDRYVARRILDPLGIARTKWDLSPSGEFQTGGGLELTSRDLAKIVWMLTDRGRWKGRQIVAGDWIGEMTTQRRPTFMGMSYGYQIWQRTYDSLCGPVDAWFMAGNGGNHMVALPSLRAAIVVTRTAYNTRNMHQQTMALIEKHILPTLPCRL